MRDKINDIAKIVVTNLFKYYPATDFEHTYRIKNGCLELIVYDNRPESLSSMGCVDISLESAIELYDTGDLENEIVNIYAKIMKALIG